MEMFSVWILTVLFYSGNRIERVYFNQAECVKAYEKQIDETRGSSSVTSFGCFERQVFPTKAEDMNAYFAKPKTGEEKK